MFALMKSWSSFGVLAGVAALVSGCSTLATVSYYEVRVATGQFVYNPPDACSGARTSAQIAIDDHAYVRVISDESSNQIEIYVPQGNSFEFVDHQIRPISGWPSLAPAPRMGEIQRTQKSRSHPFAQEYFYAKIEGQGSGPERWKLSDSAAFELRLPDAHYNGTLVQIPPLSFHLKKMTFLKGMCLK